MIGRISTSFIFFFSVPLPLFFAIMAKATEKVRKTLSLSEKQSLLNNHDKFSKVTKRDETKKLNIPRTTLVKILKRRVKIQTSGGGKRKM